MSSAAPQPLAPPDPASNWQARYWSIFTGQALSLIGSALTQFVLLWWITSTTGSVTALATAATIALLPQALLGPLGGTFADRYSRRFLMIVPDLVSALCMAVLIFLFASGKVQLWHVYTMMFIRSSMQAFQSPAAAASTAMLVPAEFLPRAAGLNQTLQGIMTVAAAPLGALAIGLFPLAGALSIDITTAVLGVLPLLFFTIPQHFIAKADRLGLWPEFRAGVSMVWDNRGLRHLYGLIGLIVMIILPAFALVPLFVKQEFAGGAPQVALMEGLAGLGMILGGAAVAFFNPKRRVLTILVAFTLSTLTLALTGLVPRQAFWLALVWWALSGFTFTFGDAPLTAVLQRVIPNAFQGRALSLLSTIMGLGGPIGLALAGPVGQWLGLRGLFVLVGSLGALVTMIALFSPELRRLEQDSQGRLPHENSSPDGLQAGSD